MERIIIFGLLSLPVLYLSWRTLFTVNSHGFFRFFSWECILWLFVSNFKYWFDDPFSIRQVISWLLLFISVYLVATGALLLKREGKPISNRADKELFQFEKTSELIDQGIFGYIRHPLYSSLLFLTWGIFLKNITIPLLFVALCSSVFLYFTALSDEKECIKFFGNQYSEYMKRTKRFIPFVI